MSEKSWKVDGFGGRMPDVGALDLSPIDEVLSKREEPEWHRPRVGVYHASQLWHCLWRQYMDFVEPLEGYDSEGARRMWLGSVIHRAIEREILPNVERSFEVVAWERPVYHGIPHQPGAMVVGMFDALIRDGAGLAVMDIKSIESLFYVSEDGPSDHDVMQLSVYQGAMNIERGLVWYLGRRSVDDRFFEVALDRSNFGWMLGQAEVLHRCLYRREPPDPKPNYGWECRVCPRRNTCPRLVEGSKGSNRSGKLVTGEVAGPETRQRIDGVELDIGDV